MVKNRVAKIKWSKPTYLGFCILEHSKRSMYEYHYLKMMPKYGKNGLKLHMTDTDSLLYSIVTEDLYEDLHEMADDYDFSDYPVTHPLHSDVNKKELFKFKDECCGVSAIEFVGLRSKMYSLAVTPDASKSTAKGIKASYQKKELRHEMYRDCLFNKKTTEASFYMIGSRNHALSSKRVSKQGLSPYEDKRYIFENTFQTLAYGHYRIEEEKAKAATMQAI